jgi:hypothetical protein
MLTFKVRSLRSRLKKLSEPPPAMMLLNLLDLCYSMRGADVDEIRRRSKDIEDDFRRLAHYIGCLGTTRSSANAIVRAMIKVPTLRQISSIRTVKPPEPRKATINREYMSPYEIVRAICKDSISQTPMSSLSALYAITDLDFWDGEIHAIAPAPKALEALKTHLSSVEMALACIQDVKDAEWELLRDAGVLQSKATFRTCTKARDLFRRPTPMDNIF